MRVCTRCGYVATGAQRYCARCVAPLDAAERADDLFARGEADTSVLPLVIDDGFPAEDDPYDPYGWSRYAPRRPRHRPPARRARMTSAALTTVALLLGVLTAWVAFGHHGPRQTAGSRLSSSQTGVGRPGRGPATAAPAHSPGPSAPQSAGSPSAVAPSAAPSPAPPATLAASQPPGGSMPVAMAPEVRGDPAAPQIEVLVASYFTAINDHDYQAYRHLLLGPLRHQLSAAQFAQTYGSTSDSDVTLVLISVNGPYAAATVTFTSKPSPGSGGDATACTSWRLTLYLQQQGGRFLVGAPPPGYHTAQHACGSAG
jgi:eukaryotic-like serine/threonine-protein kinase